MVCKVSRGIFAALTVGVWLAAAPMAHASLEGSPFGIATFEMQPIEQTRLVPLGSEHYEIVNDPYKSSFTQAGSHPWALRTMILFDTEELVRKGKPGIFPTRDPKDVVVDLPPGLLGNPMATPRCSLTQVLAFGKEPCPTGTQIGEYRLLWKGNKQYVGPIINVVPEFGQSAEFTFENEAKINPVLTGHLIRTAQGYGFTVVSNAIPMAEIYGVETIFWGVPGDPSHDQLRGLECNSLRTEPLKCKGGGAPAGAPAVPFLTWPTDCAAGTEQATVRADSWQEPGHVDVNQQFVGYVERALAPPLPAVTGCDLLKFEPTIELEPSTPLADEPVGPTIDLRVPLNETPISRATPQLQNSVVTLPAGMSVSPGVVDGVQACEESGPHGINITGPESEEIGVNGELQLASGHCPDASAVGTAEAITPFLPEPIEGHVYLAKPLCGGAGQAPCTTEDAADGRLYRLYLELGGTGALASTGVHFKVALETHVNPATGQLTTVASGTPQAPFSELVIHLNEGPKAPLANPPMCGPATTSSDFNPWSAPGTTPEGLFVAGTPDATPSSFFDVIGCASPPGLKPGFVAGTALPQAAQFSSFTLNLTRQDREQYVKGIQLHTPPGLLGMLSAVPLCEEAQANAGACPEASRIGTTRVASGAGSHPFEISGSVYLTGPYRGAPFGLSIVTNAVAGPFNLGLVIVRARIDVDQHTSALTVTADENGPHAIPQLLFGVPLRLQRITVDVDRPGFMFNPTSCGSQQQITGVVSGAEGARATVASPFSVVGCKALTFKPSFKVSTNGHTSRANGASLDAKVSYPKGALGTEANIARVKVSLPKQLPSRLSTLQKACPAATFERDAAACPSASVVGMVRAQTPLLPVELHGPVYFVSHGGEAFPSLVVVLQGDGVRVDLIGTTFISKAGITSSTFKTVPDVPVRSFELFLPQGKSSALAANGNLCKSRSKLKMPTTFVAQNGLQLKQTTKIAVAGCAAKRIAKRARAHRARSHSDRGGHR